MRFPFRTAILITLRALFPDLHTRIMKRFVPEPVSWPQVVISYASIDDYNPDCPLWRVEVRITRRTRPEFMYGCDHLRDELKDGSCHIAIVNAPDPYWARNFGTQVVEEALAIENEFDFRLDAKEEALSAHDTMKYLRQAVG
jgi:hypothetical protein